MQREYDAELQKARSANPGGTNELILLQQCFDTVKDLLDEKDEEIDDLKKAKDVAEKAKETAEADLQQIASAEPASGAAPNQAQLKAQTALNDQLRTEIAQLKEKIVAEEARTAEANEKLKDAVLLCSQQILSLILSFEEK